MNGVISSRQPDAFLNHSVTTCLCYLPVIHRSTINPPPAYPPQHAFPRSEFSSKFVAATGSVFSARPLKARVCERFQVIAFSWHTSGQSSLISCRSAKFLSLNPLGEIWMFFSRRRHPQPQLNKLTCILDFHKFRKCRKTSQDDRSHRKTAGRKGVCLAASGG